MLFGLAVGIREQALTLGAAFPLDSLEQALLLRLRRFRSMLRFGARGRMRHSGAGSWFLFLRSGGICRTDPNLVSSDSLGSSQLRNNMEFSLLYAFILCPGAWLAVAGAGVYRLFAQKQQKTACK